MKMAAGESSFSFSFSFSLSALIVCLSSSVNAQRIITDVGDYSGESTGEGLEAQLLLPRFDRIRIIRILFPMLRYA